MNVILRKVVALLALVPVLYGGPVQAQEDTVLKVSYEGNLLPQGTVVVVLHKPATLRENGLYQPEFVARDAYPRSRDLVLALDTLDGRRQTRHRYPKTEHSGHVYFLYARTQSGDLYWSYSASVDSLKFDVVNRGVMAVAPVRDATARAEIVRLFFEPAPPEEDPVVVYLREDSAAAAEVTPPDEAAPAFEQAGQDTLLQALLSAAREDPAEVAEPSAREGIVVPAALFYGLLVLLVASLATLAYLALTWRRELAMLRRERYNFWIQEASSRLGANRSAAHIQALEEAARARERAERELSALTDRYNALRRELAMLQAEQDEE